MIIDCISDLHGNLPKLEGGDLLIVAGDLTAQDQLNEYINFFMWLSRQSYDKKIFIGGNHDVELQERFTKFDSSFGIDYLNNRNKNYLGLKIWGSPWTLSFEGMNPLCKAFTVDTEEELSKKWNKIPDDTDILITHSPPYGILDATEYKKESMRVGSSSLRSQLETRLKPRLHVFGHIHEGHGEIKIGDTQYVNAAIMNRYYEPINKPIRVIL